MAVSISFSGQKQKKLIKIFSILKEKYSLSTSLLFLTWNGQWELLQHFLFSIFTIASSHSCEGQMQHQSSETYYSLSLFQQRKYNVFSTKFDLSLTWKTELQELQFKYLNKFSFYDSIFLFDSKRYFIQWCSYCLDQKKYKVRSQGSWAKHDLRKTMCCSQMIFNNIIMTCVKATLIP